MLKPALLVFSLLQTPIAKADFRESFRDAWNDRSIGKMREYANVEIREAKVLLDAGLSSPVCGYTSVGVWAASALRFTLASLKEQTKYDLVVSAPAMYNDQTVCVTVSIRGK